MSRPPHRNFNLKEKIEKLKEAGFSFYGGREKVNPPENADDELDPLSKRIKFILDIIQNGPVKSTDMNYLILYDIEKDKVRGLIAKYLLSKGCIRIQKSVFLAHSDNKKFDEIKNTLQEVNSYYDNEDSIILIPLNVSDARSMKLIGRNVNMDQIIDPPGTVFI